MVEARHIARQVDVAWVAVAAVGAVVAGADVVDEYLHVLVAVIFLFGFEAQRRAQLGTNEGVVGLWSDTREVVVGATLDVMRVVALGITGIGELSVGGEDGDFLLVEQAAAGHVGAGGHRAVFRRQDGAVAVEHLEAVLARGAVLVLVGIVAGGVLADGNVLVGFVDSEGHGAGVVALIAREVNARNGGERDHAPVDSLSDGGVARAGDSERAARGIGHLKRAHGPRTLPHHQCCYRQHQREDLVKFLGKLF